MTVRKPFELYDGRSLRQGEELTLVDIQPNEIAVKPQGATRSYRIEAGVTDVMERVQQLTRASHPSPAFAEAP